MDLATVMTTALVLGLGVVPYELKYALPVAAFVSVNAWKIVNRINYLVEQHKERVSDPGAVRTDSA